MATVVDPKHSMVRIKSLSKVPKHLQHFGPHLIIQAKEGDLWYQNVSLVGRGFIKRLNVVYLTECAS